MGTELYGEWTIVYTAWKRLSFKCNFNQFVVPPAMKTRMRWVYAVTSRLNLNGRTKYTIL